MNRKRTPEELLRESLGRFSEPPTKEMESFGERMRARLRSGAGDCHDAPVAAVPPARSIRKPLFAAAVVVAVMAFVTGSGILKNGTSSDSPVAKSAPVRVSTGHIENHHMFHSDGTTGTTLLLPDDSRVEMRARTDLSFEHAADGLRILLKEGSILVNAAAQRTGHLYVQTKDVTISVVGTVFLVRAEQQGSRVAVIEGEVRVQQGATTERLLPGEQVATSSLMSARPVIEEISWSTHAEEHLAMLQQSPIPSVTAGEPPDTFELASIRPSPAPPGGPGARGGGGGPVALPCPTANAFEMSALYQLDPGRLVMRRQTLYSLIAFAYGHSCPAPGTLTGGLDWTNSERFDLEAKIPAGTPEYTKEQLFSGNAPRLQRMLQNLLADRFKLVLQRDVKETQGYYLILVQEGKLKLSSDQRPDQAPAAPARGGGLRGVIGIPSVSAPISRLVSMLQRTVDRPIVDKTGLTGLYDIWLEFPEIPVPTPPPDGTPVSEIEARMNQTESRIRDLLPAKLEAFGLKLEPAKVPVQVLVLVNVEKPSPN